MTDDELIGVLDRLCDALVEPAYRSALAYRERDGSTALGATRLWPACPRTRSHIGMGHDPEVPFWDTRESAGDSPDVSGNPLQRSPKPESVVPLSCQYGR